MEETLRERSRRTQIQAVLGFVLICCAVVWGQPADESRDPELSALRIAGSADGSNAPYAPAEPMDGGNGGVIEICTGLDVPLEGGATEDLTGSVFLPSGEYFFRQVATPQRIAANFDWSTAPPLTLRVQGEVVIYCEGLFDARIEGDFSLGSPSVTVYAGDPLVRGSSSNRLSHNVYLNMSAPDTNEPLDGGRFTFHTSAVGRAPFGHPIYGDPSLGDHATLSVKGGEGRYGGSGGHGGAIRVCARGPGLVAFVSGGDGGDALKPATDGGRGGDAGEICVATDGDPGRVVVSCGYGAGKGGDGGAGMAPNSIEAAGQGGDGGSGARIAVTAAEVLLNAQVPGGHGGQGAGTFNLGQAGATGGAGGQAGTVWCEADIVDFAIAPDLRGGNGGTGGSGASGGDGGRGGNGGPGGTIDCLATDVTIDGAWAYGGHGGSGGNGGQTWSEAGGRGGDGGLGGEAAHLIGLEAILQPQGLVPGMSATQAQFPSGLNFLWYDGQPGSGGNGGGSGMAAAGDGGDGWVGGAGGNALYLGAIAGNGGDAWSGCSGTGLCVVIDSYGWPMPGSIPHAPGRGGEGFAGGPGGADGAFSDCDFNPAVPLEQPQMPCDSAAAIDPEADLEDASWVSD